MWQVYQYPGVQLVLPQLDPLVDQSVVAFRLHPFGTRVEHFEPVRVQVFVFRLVAILDFVDVGWGIVVSTEAKFVWNQRLLGVYQLVLMVNNRFFITNTKLVSTQTCLPS